jgi:hypothetical protein
MCFLVNDHLLDPFTPVHPERIDAILSVRAAA